VNTPRPPHPGVLLEDLTWIQAEARLTPETLVVIPIGAAAKEHGPHLLLKNDFILAEYFKRRVLEAAPVVIAPTVTYHFYPAFVEYPGSITLQFDTARDLIIDICKSLAAFGPYRFYALNTGVSTARPLAAAAEELAVAGILLRYTDIKKALGPIEAEVCQQEGGSHADESETSMLLYMDPASVNMSLAAKDYTVSGTVGLSRKPGGPSTYSPTGIWGDATLATREKGEKIVNAMVRALLEDIEAARSAPLPSTRRPEPKP
jgi:creatinine amidohydrolase